MAKLSYNSDVSEMANMGDEMAKAKVVELRWTPGPWQYAAVNGGWDGVKPAKHNTPICALVENNPANAYLIAAAPDLYTELADLVRLMEPKEHNGWLGVPVLATLNAARKALSKARGE